MPRGAGRIDSELAIPAAGGLRDISLTPFTYGAYELVCARRASSLDKAAINGLVRESGQTIFHTYEWMSMYETADFENLDGTYYLLVNRANSHKLAAFVPLYHSPYFLFKEEYESKCSRDVEILHQPMLLTHTVYAAYSTPPAADPLPEIMPAILTYMHELARSLSVPFYGFSTVCEAKPLLVPLLEHYGFVCICYEANQLLDISRWSDANSYFGALPRKIRGDLWRRERKAFREGARVISELTPPVLSRYHALLSQTYERHDTAFNLSEAGLVGMIEILQPYLRFFGLEVENRLVCGVLVLEHEGVLYPCFGGFDLDAGRLYSPYIVFFGWVLRYAFEQHARTVDVGRTNHIFKAKYLCRPEKSHLCLRTVDPAGKPALRRALAEFEETLGMNRLIDALVNGEPLSNLPLSMWKL